MKNYIIILFFFFQACKAQNKEKINFIYHTADYNNLGVIQEERIYNSSISMYEYKNYSDNNLSNTIIKSTKLYIKFTPEDLHTIQKLYASVKSEMSNCYFENNVIIHKSTITYDSQKDNFSLIKCSKKENSIFTEIEKKIEGSITSSTIYKKTFYGEFYKK
jgi:hypothetical protein